MKPRLRAPDLRRLAARLRPRRGLIAALLGDAASGTALLDRAGRVLRAGGGKRLGALADFADPAPALLRAALADGRALTLAARLGEEPVSLSLTPAQAGCVAAVLRVTGRSREAELEEALGQAQRLQEVGELAGGIAHDFNNLLTAILGAAEDLSARAAAEDRPDLEQIRASATRGAELVRQLLAFSQRQTLQPRVLVLDEAVANAAALLRRLLGSGVTLDLKLNAPGRRVHMDATQLDQVLMNLAINARNAMPAGGTITIETGWRLVLREDEPGPDAVPPGRYATIDMTDTGAGIPPDILPRIFDPFFTTRRGSGGTGLGLSMVQGIVRQSGGSISVRSTPGQGTRFRITLPRHEAAATPRAAEPPAQPPPAQPPPPPPPPPQPPPTADGARRRILLVDDDDAIRSLARRTLSRAGWTVIEADGAESALRADVDGVDCVVSDVTMPGLDGPTLVRRLRQTRPSLPAILMSGYADAGQRRALAAEDIAFVPKPFAMAELTRAVRAALAAAEA